MSAVLIPTASEAEWLEARRHGVTASEIAVLMGLSPYDSPYGLYHRKLGTLPAQEQDDAMALGSYMEQFIAGRFAALHPEFAVLGTGRDLWRHGDRPWQMATPDRTLSEIGEVDACTCGADLQMHYGHEPRCGQELRGTVALLETKIDGGSDEWGVPGTDEIPVHYRAQVLWQCDVMGMPSWFVACLDWNSRKVRVYQGFIDDAAQADLKLMRDEARDFLDRLDLRDPPDVDWRPATLAALKTMHPEVEDRDVEVRRSLAIQYRAAVRRAKEAERRKDEMTARMLAAMGGARRAVSYRAYAGVGDPDDVIATRSVSHPKRIDTDKLRTLHPAIAAECTKPPKPEVKLTPAKPKKDKEQ